MQNTPLTATHEALGAKMMGFAGYNMPVVYTTINEEHEAVRNQVGLFDVSHMGEFILKGQHAMDLIQKVTSNDVSKLEIGDAQYSCLPNHDGGIVDDLLVYRLPEDKCSEGERAYMLVVNASNIEKDWNWISQHNDLDVQMTDISDRTGLLALQGPKAAEVLQKLTETDVAAIEFYHFTKGSVAGVGNVIISATGYTGSGGFELYADAKDIKVIWDALMEAGADSGILPCGLGARDTLRLEKGYCLYGNDIDDTTSPLEAGLGWITKLKVDADFNSKDIFIQQKAEGIQNKLVGFKVNDRRVPRKDYEIKDEAGNVMGRVTSGTLSPSLSYPIGMGYVKKEFATVGTKLLINTGRKDLEAEVVKLPFL
jgi:aminomethyltransferase